MFEQIDIYCERTDFSVFSEPVNALTNAVFFIAAYFLYRLAENTGNKNPRTLLLIALIAIIGTGSTLFHTLATVWAVLLDSLPILIYQICFIIIYARAIMLWGWRQTALLLGGFFIAMAMAMNAPRGWLNGSMEYIPALGFVTLLGILHTRYATKERFGLLLSAGFFILSVTLRSVDMALCSVWPVGTHFLWHCFNGAVLYTSARAIIINMQPRDSR